ncbi:unnamed protein product [Periconia digitata]|uniref:Uncharacterized protein n=1 Tax=Periconia digitata TaxID=1303443 RepID=A0A9W4UL27_9PLEO|nr:unnamed protein product [Periconia digitata]
MAIDIPAIIADQTYIPYCRDTIHLHWPRNRIVAIQCTNRCGRLFVYHAALFRWPLTFDYAGVLAYRILDASDAVDLAHAQDTPILMDNNVTDMEVQANRAGTSCTRARWLNGTFCGGGEQDEWCTDENEHELG